MLCRTYIACLIVSWYIYIYYVAVSILHSRASKGRTAANNQPEKIWNKRIVEAMILIFVWEKLRKKTHKNSVRINRY